MVPDKVTMLELPLPAVKVMVFPGIGLLPASNSVTVTVEVVAPSAETVPGLDDTVDLEAEADPTRTLKVIVPEVKLSPVAWIVTGPAVWPVRVKFATPAVAFLLVRPVTEPVPVV